MRYPYHWLVIPMLLSGCPYFSVRSTGKAVVMLRPSYTVGGYETKVETPVYAKASINHLVLKLYSVNGETETAVLDAGGQVARDIKAADLDNSIIFGNLRSNTTYRIRGYAYKALGTASEDLISDVSSYVDIAVLTEDRPSVGAIPIKLIDRNFSGTGSSSFVVNPGGYSTPYSEGFASFYNTVYAVRTIAGGIIENRPATEVAIDPYRFARDAAGNFYIADKYNHRIRKVTSGGLITTIAGSGVQGFFGDGGPATSAQLSNPQGVATDGAGTVYFTDNSNHRIRKIAPDGTISTIAGDGLQLTTVDGAEATATSINNPHALARDSLGNLYVVVNSRDVYKIAPNGIVTKYAGNGATAYGGDGVDATSTSLYNPYGLAVDKDDNLLIADINNNRIRKVDKTTHLITTVAGNGTPASNGDGADATAASINQPNGVAGDAQGNIYIFENVGSRVRKVTTDGKISTIAGNGTGGFSGDGGPATAAQINYPLSGAVDAAGNLYFADSGNKRIRKIATDGTITTFVGNGLEPYCAGVAGDGGALSAALFNYPGGLLLKNNGEKYLSEAGRIRKVASNGTLTTIAGNGTAGTSGDGGQALQAQVNPGEMGMDLAGNLYFADANRVRKIGLDGIITTVAGNGLVGSTGDGGQATNAKTTPRSIAVTPSGEIYIAEYNYHRIRKVGLDGNITTVAGNGTSGTAGDGGAATAANLKTPSEVLVDSAGVLYIADTGSHRIRKVGLDGNISTVAGNGSSGTGGDGGAATSATLNTPSDIAFDFVGNLYILTSTTIRKVTPNGIISTIAGPWISGYSGDNGNALSAQFSLPADLQVDMYGGVYVVDKFNHVIRKLD